MPGTSPSKLKHIPTLYTLGLLTRPLSTELKGKERQRKREMGQYRESR